MDMDFMAVDVDAPPQSKSDADLALYLATSNTSSSRASPLPWHAADDGYGFVHNALGLYDASNDLGYGWSEEEANRYIVANHPLVEHETELSDHSHTTDSGSRGSSNQYSDPSFTNHTENGYHGEGAWYNFSTYGSGAQETLLPPLRMGSPGPSGLHLPESHLSMYLPSPTPRPHLLGLSGPDILPHAHHSPQDSDLLLPPLRDLFVDHPSPLSSASSPQLSSSEGQYVSPEEINAPHTSLLKGDAADPDLRGTSSSDDTPIKNSARLTRLGNGKSTRGGRGGARGGRRNGSTDPFHNSHAKEAPLSTESRSKRRRPSYTSSSDTSVTSRASIPLHKRPKRKAASKAAATFTDSDSGDDSGDAYLPSRSPSPDISQSDDARSTSPEYSQHKSKKRVTMKGTGASKMSAAEALAQIAAEKARLEIGGGDSQDYQPYHRFESGKRKNGTIPLPVPVPHLNKKSRGRKVPYVDARASRPRPSEDEPETSAGGSRGTPSRRGRGGRRGAGGARSFVCVVPGCGKCFIRGEHLKRHVRSIHTHDKPHQCPYDGCDKSFSRRDNLGQHVRLHLMDSL